MDSQDAISPRDRTAGLIASDPAIVVSIAM